MRIIAQLDNFNRSNGWFVILAGLGILVIFGAVGFDFMTFMGIFIIYGYIGFLILYGLVRATLISIASKKVIFRDPENLKENEPPFTSPHLSKRDLILAGLSGNKREFAEAELFYESQGRKVAYWWLVHYAEYVEEDVYLPVFESKYKPKIIFPKKTKKPKNKKKTKKKTKKKQKK